MHAEKHKAHDNKTISVFAYNYESKQG